MTGVDKLTPANRLPDKMVTGDAGDPEFLTDVLRGHNALVHLAAIPDPFRDTAFVVLDTNLRLANSAVAAAKAADVRRLVFASSQTALGLSFAASVRSPAYLPIDEAHPLNGQSPYAASKVGADQMALAFQRSFGTPVVLLRPFNTFGPRQSARAVIPTIISQIASGANQVKLGSLHPTRDFSFVTDTARAFMHAAVADGCVGETINSGSGFEISVGDTAALIAEVMGAKVEVVCADERVRPEASEVERLFAGVEKAQRCMGWTPEYGGREGFARGLGKTIDWFREPANLARYRPERYAT